MADRNAAVCGVAAAFLTLASIAVIVRCYVRLRIVKAFGWDDTVMIIAMLFYAMFCGCMIGGSIYGTGKHLTELTPEHRVIAMKYWFLCDLAYAVSSVLAKISVCIFLLRIMLFPWHRMALYMVTGFTICTGIVFFVLMAIQCSPVSFWWNRMAGATDGKCGYVTAIAIMLYIFSVSSALFDLTVGLLPILLVRNLQMNHRTKIAVAGLLGMACIASVAIITRIPFVPTIHETDFLYATVQIAIWSCIEVGLSITAGSLATIRPIFRGFLSRTSSTYRPFSDDPSNPNSSNKRKPKFLARRPSDSLALTTLNGGTELTRSGSISAPASTSHYSNSLDKERVGVESTYIGTLSTMQSTVAVEGSYPSNLGRLRRHSGALVEGRDARRLLVPHRAVNSMPGIGVHRTFEVSSEGGAEV